MQRERPRTIAASAAAVVTVLYTKGAGCVTGTERRHLPIRHHRRYSVLVYTLSLPVLIRQKLGQNLERVRFFRRGGPNKKSAARHPLLQGEPIDRGNTNPIFVFFFLLSEADPLLSTQHSTQHSTE